MATPAKNPSDLPLDAVAQALGLDIFDYQPADVLRMVGCLVETNEELAEQNLRFKQQGVQPTLLAQLAENKLELEGLHQLSQRQAKILSTTAIALRGPEPPLTMWSHHDVAELAADAVARLAQAEAHSAAAQSALESATDTNRVLAERLEKAAEVLKGYEQWEANVIEEDAAWATPAAHPWQTEELYDEWMNLQYARNQVLHPTVKGAQQDA